jgi:hypothetical protein
LNFLIFFKFSLFQVETVADGGSNCGGIDPPGSHTAPLWDLKRDLVLLREELQEKNTTIKTLKNQLRAVNGRTSVNKNKESTATTKASASCNVATQTDRVIIICCYSYIFVVWNLNLLYFF